MNQITNDLLYNSKQQILSSFYERSMSDLRPEVRIYIEEELLTGTGLS